MVSRRRESNPGGWIDVKEFLESLPENPSEHDLRKVLGIANDGEHWANRRIAVDILGRNQYSTDEISSISLTDSHPVIRENAKRWLTDYEGEMLKYGCQQDTRNPFGQDSGRIHHPVEGIVAAIDSDGYNTELYRVGLSAIQMGNLGMQRRSEPLNQNTLRDVIDKNMKGLLDGQNFGNLVVEAGGEKVSAQVYNAFGPRAIGGSGIRISSIMAEDLDLELEDRVRLYKE